ncbi:cilia- and flagella- associated protein 210 isoform X2 [Castor canadensis]|uniref:Cilia- and flagella- associated protein 210 isoform X2 n=1 Tax=Castor canadensis TaxID=51338 RepID=A0AC58MCN0_CASCN
MLVQFGRRSGQAREGTEKKNSKEDDICYPPLLPSKVDLRQVTIIPHNEWKRIQDSLDRLTREAAALRAERKAKKELHFKSQNVVKHWTNTYAGMKEQKLKAKKKRDEEIEAERQNLDVEEEIYKQGERKKAIENAKQYQFYQTERVKNFNSGLLLSRVMKERDAQIEFQKSRIKSDKKWEDQLKVNIAKAFKEEQEKAEKRHRERIALAKDHLKQIKEHEEEKEQRRKLEEKDAEEIKRQNSLYEIEMKNKLNKKKEEIDASRRRFFAKNKFNAKEAKQEELDYWRHTEMLAAEKEKEFQNYAREVIKFESESGNKHIYPLVKAAQKGPGGGRGPAFVDRSGVKPSYQANDSTGGQLPFYNPQRARYNDFQKSKGRLGFTW